MKVAKFQPSPIDDEADVGTGRRPQPSGRLGVIDDTAGTVRPLSDPSLRIVDLLTHGDPLAMVRDAPTDEAMNLSNVRLLPPIDVQEVWAAGVTYKRSQTARMEESETAASVYDQVYDAPRPEIFFKAPPRRVRGDGQPLRIRGDAAWNVPEPEITLAVNSAGNIIGLTVGNDMSSRDIEGDNPLYLPQAKTYDDCAGLGPWITLLPPDQLPDASSIGVDLAIRRSGEVVFDGKTDASQMHRRFVDLVRWLFRDNTFPDGCFLMTGTGIVPDSDFTLADGDVVSITVDHVGTLRSPITQTPVRDPERWTSRPSELRSS